MTDPTLAEASIVHSTPLHIPGRPLEIVEDRRNREQVEAEKADHVDTAVPEPAEYGTGPDTRSARLNLASRSNIVSAGPGSAGHEVV